VLFNNAKKTSEELGITKIPPGGIFLLDCQETSSLVNLEEAFCMRHPEVEQCANRDTNGQTPQ
ncbi:MAG: hypothetical protein NUV67_03525, partial [archaeon]|nr:hypothetical protein [archaeon]